LDPDESDPEDWLKDRNLAGMDPEDWFMDRKLACTDGLDMWPHVGGFFGRARYDEDLERVVWICLGDGSPSTLSFPDIPDRPFPVSAATMANCLTNITKPTLVILDSCGSATFIRAVLDAMSEPPIARKAPDGGFPVGFLTSGPGKSRSSAVVISNNPNDPFPQITVTAADGKPRTIGFRVGHSMFTRGWLREVVYSTEDLKLSDLAALLNSGKNRGFFAEFLTNCPGMKDVKLREFFPAPVQPTDAVRGYPGDICFGQVVLFAPLGGLYDDRGDDTDLPADPDGAFVLVDSGEGPFTDRSPRSSCIVEKGFMNASTSPTVALAAALHFEGPKPEAPPVYIPLERIAELVVRRVEAKYPGRSRDESVYQNTWRWQTMGQLARKLNGSALNDALGYRLLAAWTVGIPRQEVLEMMSAARVEIARELGIPLGSAGCETVTNC
jgi:hypothetical protein